MRKLVQTIRMNIDALAVTAACAAVFLGTQTGRLTAVAPRCPTAFQDFWSTPQHAFTILHEVARGFDLISRSF